MIYAGITENRKLIVLDELVFNNANRETPIAPSDTVQRIVSFMDKNRNEWGFTRTVFIDNADAATITECHKYSRLHGSVYDFVGSYKKTPIIDRINLELGWLAKDEYLVVDDCVEHIHELETYSWLEDKDAPEDAHDHTVNASQYAWLPYTGYIGTQ
jgi:phage terminase large subunit